MQSERIYGWGMLAVLFALVLLRLLVWKIFPAFETFVKEDLSNLFCAVAILLVAAFFYGRKALLGRQLQDRRTGLELPLLVYFVACALSLVPSVDRSATLRYVIVLFSYILFFFMLAETLEDAVRRKWFFLFLMGMALVVAGWGIRDYVYLITRPSSPADRSLQMANDSLYYILVNKRACSFFGWPNVLAAFLGLTIPLGFVAAMTWRERWQKLAAWAGLAMMLAALLLTFSFLGWSSFLLGFLAVLAILFFRHAAGVHRGVKAGAILFALIAAVLFTIVIVKKNFSSSATPRKQYIHECVKAIAQHPVLGTGLDSFRYASSRTAADKDGLTAFAHNSYLQVWVEAGIPGFLSMLFLIFMILRKFYRMAWRPGDLSAGPWWGIAFVWAFTAFAIDNVWSFTIIKPNISLFFWVVLGFACSFEGRSVNGREHKWPVRQVVGWLAVAVIAALIFLTLRGIAVQWLCQKAFRAEMSGRPAESLSYLRRARAIDPSDGRLAFESGKRQLAVFQQTGDRRFLAAAEQDFLSAVELSPFYGPRAMLGLVYRSQGRMSEARDWLVDAYSAAPFETTRDLRALGILR